MDEQQRILDNISSSIIDFILAFLIFVCHEFILKYIVKMEQTIEEKKGAAMISSLKN